ncbi:unnamed protein product [Staurois parvus]|uniref:Uncharacterized protein n=1 Tax=Staurois parvus TaxID=386267 RepID=A0ABN9AWN8_9NEOB|nr:unnamed protein product [Staurois parvus]
MTLGRKGLSSMAIKGLTVCCVLLGRHAVQRVLCMAVLCNAIQSSLQELTGERSMLFIYR